MNTEFLKELGLEQEAIDKIMAENGKDIAKEQQKTATAESNLKAKKTELGELSEKVKELKSLEGSEQTIADLKGKIADFETAEETRKAAEKVNKENAALLATFEEVTEGKTFVNDFTKNAIFESCKAELSKDKTKVRALRIFFQLLPQTKKAFSPTQTLRATFPEQEAWTPEHSKMIKSGL